MRNKIRVTGGEWRSRIITFDSCAGLRPTPDRVRETVFNWLGQDMSGKRCLDLFAGSGAMSFEAASRGAARVVMVESNPVVMKTLKINIQKLGAERIELILMDALKFLASDRHRFDLIFVDPPYRLGLLPTLLSSLHSHLGDSGLVYVENDSLPEPGADDWLAWRQAQAGKVRYQLLKSKKNG
jgi:16S rRNA (guanine(966)-N(2))-methyltransferase RsmD